MKKIEAIIRPDKLEDLKDGFSKVGFTYGMTVSQVLGHGNQQGFAEYVRGQRIIPTLLAKVKVEIIVPENDLENMIDIICDSVSTGEIGDGKIFITTIDEAIRIRTKQRGDEAL